ncbi:hypothetical protein KPL78_00965 [Roseomonas sp. HJA6]|uniref:DUF6998 domain-containing protein n=1 Tax=Roseomonas alba TaxID=2846776 RepID=A0ABS7A260_9PROT|nr:hypothetical protein [Neoroseomonas alba]
MPGRPLPLPEPVARIYDAVRELEATYPGRRFTPDGHMVGSIGEVIAAEAFGLTLLPMSATAHDARDAMGRDVQVKLTGGNSIAMYDTCDRLLVLRITADKRHAEVIYDGDGAPVWGACRPMQKNGQRTISVARLRAMALVAAEGDSAAGYAPSA